ncbi:MAG: hypothetical protein ACRDM0_00410 [Thermoleophilaceae bacterium]
MGDNKELVLPLGAVAAAIAWWATYTILGGKLGHPFGPVTWGMRWRSLVALIVALVVFALVGSLVSRL